MGVDRTVLAYRAASGAARIAPDSLVLPAAAVAGAVASRAGAASKMLERHLSRVDHQLDGRTLARARRQAFGSYARYWIESFRLPHLSKAEVAAGLRVDGYHTHVLEALDRGKGVILALPHLGGWEWAGRWLADNGHRVTVVVEEIQPPALFEWFVELRSSLGMNVVPLGRDAGREILAALGRNEIVCLLSDRDLGESGIEVEFFGETTRIPAGPATVGLRSGAPVLPTAVYFTDSASGHFGLVHRSLDMERRGPRLRDDIGRITQDLARELEQLIRRAPTQWHLLQPNWPSDPGYSLPETPRPADIGATS